MLPIIHFVGTMPLLMGLVAQSVVLTCALRAHNRSAAVQAMVLMFALGMIGVSVMQRPKAPVDPRADFIGCAGAAGLLAPGVEALWKPRRERKKAAAGHTESARA